MADLAPSARGDFVWLAIEHPEALAPPERARIAAELAAIAVPVFTTTAALASFGSVVIGARAQLEHGLRSRVVVTDSAGHRDLAFATGTPCVVLPGLSPASPAIVAGVGTSTTLRVGDLRAAIARVRDHQARPVPHDGAAARIADQFLGWPGPGDHVALPSDADASGRSFGDDEIALVTAVLRRGTLNSTKGTFVNAFERRFAQWLGRKHAIACASGSAAVHCAVAAIGLRPGDEVVTTPITDMGAITPILYEGGVPVFADVEPQTLNVTAATLRAQITPRTRALVVTHLFGMPCDMAPIRQLAEERGLVLIEDAAQAFGATRDGQCVGTFGKVAAFSLQQGKHITSGEGGIVATDDDDIARRVFLYVNKAWGYGDPKPDHYFPALNYRLTELQGAVLLAQLPRLDEFIARRRAAAARLREKLRGAPGLVLPGDPASGTHTWWKFAFFVDADVVEGGARALGKKMQAAGVACVPHYIQKPAFECALFQDWSMSPVTAMPLQNNPRRDLPMPLFHRRDYPGAVQALERVVVLPINERYTDVHVDHVAGVIRAAAQELAHA
ncbi:MAG: DegT/DnrJ/EryC1/StrS family aminotransferase [Planctomycetes bacterium]|nr:DegT/DnrJ/EryC1/StrS family aminotransferase [Planctomycetota bacterium]